ncbi:hypothetical protein CDAR_413221 [Caerostris darwini]|uniref:Reverse transcriptase Ty1/copia-type domain-containing protein n=1 Tax=Caerostris darwini TaxID=1538125 RepID=A0AAV4TP80_9ARAC|nr:hypothetical protein CDAR_413221 [Caerostris darwini]
MSRNAKRLSGIAGYPIRKQKIRNLPDYHEGALDVIAKLRRACKHSRVEAQKDIDYNKIFSSVARASIISTLISIAANENMTLMQFDVSTAFLYNSLEADIFMDQPDGFEGGTN